MSPKLDSLAFEDVNDTVRASIVEVNFAPESHHSLKFHSRDSFLDEVIEIRGKITISF